MATQTIIFFDSGLKPEHFVDVPRRLIGECPRFAQFFVEWGWQVDSSRYEWSSGDYRDWDRPFDLRRVPELWSRDMDVKLFGPGGHIYFRPRSLDWHSETKWSWFEEATLARDDFLTAASQLGRLCGAPLGVISPDSGSEDVILDLLEAGMNVSEAATLLRSKGVALDEVGMNDGCPATPPPYVFPVRGA